MSRRIVPPSGLKDESGAYVKVDPLSEVAAPPSPPTAIDISLDRVLEKQLTALSRVTEQLLRSASSGAMTNAEIQSLATVIKVTMDLKIKENELLDKLTDEELEALANDHTKQSSPGTT